MTGPLLFLLVMLLAVAGILLGFRAQRNKPTKRQPRPNGRPGYFE